MSAVALRPRDPTLGADLALVAVCLAALVPVSAGIVSPPEPPSDAAAPAIGRVEELAREARVRHDNSLVWRELESGQPVREGDTLFVGPLSKVTIALDDGARLEIEESSLVVLYRLGGKDTAATALPAFAIELRRGVASGTGGARPTEIRVGDAKVALAARSEVKVNSRDGRSAKIDVGAGAVTVATAGGKKAALAPGQRGTVGGPSTEGVTIEELAASLRAPEPMARRYFTGAPPDVAFEWTPRRGEGPWTLELSRDRDFSTIERAQPVDTARATVASLADGTWYWRVRGEAGVSDERQLSVVEDRPPAPYRPADGDVVDVSRGGPIAFAWAPVGGVRRYALELTTESGEPVAGETTLRPGFLLEQRLAEGRYCYRARSAADERGQSPWSKASCFRIIDTPILKAPKLHAPRREEVPHPSKEEGSWLLSLFISSAWAALPKASAIVLRWEPIAGAAHYVLEIAEDPKFSKVVLKESLQAPYFRWATVVRRDYYWRVRAVDAHGREGENSEPARIGSEVSAPVLASPEAGQRFVHAAAPPRIVLAWQKADVIARYRVDVAADARFSSELASFTSTGGEYAFEPGRLGDFYWRVTGTDLEGRSTEPSRPRSFTVVAAAPEATSPRAGEVLVFDETRRRFAWAPRPVEQYELEVSTDASFKKGVGRATSKQPSATLELPGLGVLYFRVRGRAPDTAWSPSSAFSVVPAAPALLFPASQWLQEPGPVELSWSKVPRATSYEVALSRNEEAPMKLQAATERWTAGTLAAGVYRWSVTALHGAVRSASSEERSFELRAPEPVAVQPAIEPRAEPAPPVVEAPAAPPPKTVFASPRIGGFFNLGAVWAVVVGLEVGYRFAAAGGAVGLWFSAGYYTGAQSAADPQGQTEARSRLHVVPLALKVQYAFATRWLKVTAALGPALDVVHALVSLEDDTFYRTSLSMGGVAAVGVERELGPGGLFAELALSVGTRQTGLVETLPAGLSLVAGYRVGLW